MENLANLLASSPPGYTILVIICIVLLGLAWYLGIPMYQENKNLREENAGLQSEIQQRLTEWKDVSDKIDTLLQNSDDKTDADVVQALSGLRLYIEQNNTATNISIESISRELEELIEAHRSLLDSHRRRDSEINVTFQRYDADLRAINDKLSQLVGAQFAISARGSNRGIS